MERIFTYSIADAFFKDLATKHVDIKDYCGTSPDELADRLSDTSGFVSPFMVFFKYSGKLEGTEQRTFNKRRLSFSILFSGIKSDDYSGQINAKNNAEIIGLEVISRINIWSKMPESTWLYKNFDKDAVIYDEIDGTEVDGLYGMEFHFDLKLLDPLTVDKTKWTDGDSFC